ncbi:MAG: hypothetical protein KatS3mg131_0362 [Candidatus Tectimicrobiota bacterium]|nr:MAG: hypothetical protein KatS3mg131_0362 [Candidatus Tectomicrobia bacterium]
MGGGAPHFRSSYLVLSKSLWGRRVRGTVGYGTGPDTLEGPFGGLEVALNRYATLLGEYDGDDVNAGLRLFPLPEWLEAYGLPRPVVDLVWQDFDEFVWGVGLRAVLGEAKYRAQRAARAQKRYQRWRPPAGQEVDWQEVATRLQGRLLAEGLENVRVSVVPWEQALLAVVEYENRRYNRDELDALGVVLGLVATHTPPAVTHAQVVVKEVNLPVLQLTVPVEAFLDFVNERLAERALAQQVHLTPQVTPLPAAPLATTPLRQRSWLKADLFLRPGIETLLLTELGVADVRFSLLPEATMQLLPGMVVSVRGRLPVTQTEGFRRFRGELDDPSLERALLHQAVRLPLGRWAPAVSGPGASERGAF